VVDGKIVAAAQEERFTRKKYDEDFHIRSSSSFSGPKNIYLDAVDAGESIADGQPAAPGLCHRPRYPLFGWIECRWIFFKKLHTSPVGNFFIID